MKRLKTMLCITLSLFFTIFSASCNKDPGEAQTYTSDVVNESINIQISTEKTNCYDEDEWVNVAYEITVKKDFWLKCSFGDVEDFIYPVALNDKYDEAYYREQFNSKTGIDIEYRLNNTQEHAGVSEAICLIHCKKDETFGGQLSVRRTYNSTRNSKAEKGKYRIYLTVGCFYSERPLDEKGERIESVKGTKYLIPTDIVLNMQ